MIEMRYEYEDERKAGAADDNDAYTAYTGPGFEGAAPAEYGDEGDAAEERATYGWLHRAQATRTAKSAPAVVDEVRRRRPRGSAAAQEARSARRPREGTRHLLLRHIPERTLDTIERIAREHDMSLSAYVIDLLIRYAERH